MARGKVLIGTSGWIYKDWTGPFYPEKLRQKDRLAYYATRFPTTEINGSFYRLPTEAASQGWHDQTPEDFVFAWKASRYITHNKKLKDVGESIGLVFGRMAPLKHKLGPALFQLPPMLHRNDERLEGFLKRLPEGARVTIEFRHQSWYAEETYALLRQYGVAFCISDHHDAPSPWLATADFVYIRGHGPGGRYCGHYTPEDLKEWAAKITAWRDEGRDVFAYFDNDQKSAAPEDAEALQALIQPEAADKSP